MGVGGSGSWRPEIGEVPPTPTHSQLQCPWGLNPSFPLPELKSKVLLRSEEGKPQAGREWKFLVKLNTTFLSKG